LLDVPWAENEELADSIKLKDIEQTMSIPNADYKIYEAIELKRSSTKEPKPVLEFDLQTAAPLRRRLDDTGVIFSLKNSYNVIVKDGGFITIDKTRGPKTNTNTEGKTKDDTKGGLFVTLFGTNGPLLDVLIRDMHPMFLTRDDWMSGKEYAAALSSYLSGERIRICQTFELWIFFRFDLKLKTFLGHDIMCDVINKNTSLRGSFKDTNLYQFYTTLLIYALKVLLFLLMQTVSESANVFLSLALCYHCLLFILSVYKIIITTTYYYEL
jgi:hypothetical protein